MSKKYSLKNAEETNKAHPDTFEIPQREERENVRVGDFVKAMFAVSREFVTPGKHHEYIKARYPAILEGQELVERMWIKVEGRTEDGEYVGALANDPVFTDLAAGDQVIFKPEHIIDILPENKSE